MKLKGKHIMITSLKKKRKNETQRRLTYNDHRSPKSELVNASFIVSRGKQKA